MTKPTYDGYAAVVYIFIIPSHHAIIAPRPHHRGERRYKLLHCLMTISSRLTTECQFGGCSLKRSGLNPLQVVGDEYQGEPIGRKHPTEQAPRANEMAAGLGLIALGSPLSLALDLCCQVCSPRRARILRRPIPFDKSLTRKGTTFLPSFLPTPDRGSHTHHLPQYFGALDV